MTDNLPSRPGEARDRTWDTRRMGNHLLLSQADIALLDSLKPICAVCNKRIDTLSWRRSIGQLSVIFTVQCHGASEDTEVSFAKFHEVMAGAVQGAKAFGGPVLTYDEACDRMALKQLESRKVFNAGE
jgi:hypothetical protein